jgi:hypothetical protein
MKTKNNSLFIACRALSGKRLKRPSIEYMVYEIN